jgi:hypothetical protein
MPEQDAEFAFSIRIIFCGGFFGGGLRVTRTLRAIDCAALSSLPQTATPA